MKKLGKVLRYIEHAVVVILLLALLGFLLPIGLTISAEEEEEGGDDGISASATAEGASLAEQLASLLPDISKIYRAAVNYPLQKAEEDISDPDILEFYQGYLKETGLGGNEEG